MKLLTICLTFLGLLGGVAAGAQPTHARQANAGPATLRVGLWTLWREREIAVSPAREGTATVRLCSGCVPSPLTHPVRIAADSSRVSLGGGLPADAILISGPVALSAHGETLTFQEPVRVAARAGVLVLAVTLPVERYVERVVASEGGSADSLESLKALAIVVRSFALHQPHGHADYDLCDSTHCQLLHWGGNPERRSLAHAATLSTAGETLWYRGARAAAWFHQNSGGRTASPSEVWGGAGLGRDLGRKPMPWLVSHEDPYCTGGDAREWSAQLSLAELTAALAAQGLARPGWNSLSVARRGESGRAVTLLADSTPISAEDLRLAIGRTFGWGKILSTWFEVSRQGDQFFFHGRGSGHGVGLCQAGAAAMAAQGLDSTRILGQYFPGAYTADEATGKSWQSFPAQRLILETLAPADSKYLPQLSQALAEAESRSGLHPALAITVRAFGSTGGFRDATLAPGWVAAFTEGNWIGTQPLATLASRSLLIPILRHEFLHALVEGQAAPGTPLWLREGLVEALADGSAKEGGAAPLLRLDGVERALGHASTEGLSAAAHRGAGFYASRLLNRYGRDQVLAWLRSGLPNEALAAVR